MGYVLRAVLGEHSALAHATPLLTHSRVVPLSATMGMIPATDDLIDSFNTGQVEAWSSFPGFHFLSTALADVLVSLSERRLVAYVEAEYFGGVGEQCSIVWQNRQVAMGPIKRSGAINKALRLLGVRRSFARDEFNVLGLGRHREKEDWLEEVTTTQRSDMKW